MTGKGTRVQPAIRLTVGVALILLSVPSFRADAVPWVFHGIDDRMLAVAVAVLGCWAAFDGVRGIIRARNAAR